MSSPNKSGSNRFEPQLLLEQLNERFPRPAGYCIALSGGLDSTVLLHAIVAIRGQLRAPLSAIHIDHALQTGSADWMRHCRQQCGQLGIALRTLQVDAFARPGESPEAAARHARYAAIAAALGPRAMLLTAHHQDDQAETLLLQLLRGSGVEGLAAMPAIRAWQGGWHARPLLTWRRTALQAWAAARQLHWIDDPSNAQTVADRNYLRHQVLPQLRARWPAATDNIAHSAVLCAEAAESLRRQAQHDLHGVLSDDRRRLRVAALRELSPAAARRVLRRWLHTRAAPPLPRRRLHEAVEQLCEARPDAALCVVWGGHELRRFRDEVWLMRQDVAAIPSEPLDWVGDELALGPGLGRLRRRAGPGGIDRACWEQGRVQVRYRAAGLRCRPAGRSGSRSFKKIAQELRIPPWRRDRMPLIYIDGRIAAIADVCVCEPFAAPKGDIGWIVDWADR